MSFSASAESKTTSFGDFNAENSSCESLQVAVDKLRLEISDLETSCTKARRRIEAAQEVVDEGNAQLGSASAALEGLAAQSGGAANAAQVRAPVDLSRTRDVYALEERLLELQLLKKPLEKRVGEARTEALRWQRRAEEVKADLDAEREDLSALPSMAHETNVEVLQRLSALREKKRGADRTLRDANDRLQRAQQQHERGGGGGGGGGGPGGGISRGDDLDERLDELDEQLGDIRRDTRRWRERYESGQARLEPLEAPYSRPVTRLGSAKRCCGKPSDCRY